MCGPEYVLECFRRHAAGADIAVVEGVMGMYDGDSSTASLASLLHVPVILVVDAYGMAESAGAVVEGFVNFGLRIPECGMETVKSEIRRFEIRTEIRRCDLQPGRFGEPLQEAQRQRP